VPKMFLLAPKGAFTAEARAGVAAELTELGMACERLIDTPQVRAGIWVYFVEHAPDTVFRAGRQAAEPIMSLKVYALKGGFNAETKTRMVTEATAILCKYSKTNDGQIPAYVGILEVPEENWGMYGQLMANRFTWPRCRSRDDPRRAQSASAPSVRVDTASGMLSQRDIDEPTNGATVDE
jgi:phenylpyruvate tautomerase PptA (4-oxalocrotonate tautomerase family)